FQALHPLALLSSTLYEIPLMIDLTQIAKRPAGETTQCIALLWLRSSTAPGRTSKIPTAISADTILTCSSHSWHQANDPLSCQVISRAVCSSMMIAVLF